MQTEVAIVALVLALAVPAFALPPSQPARPLDPLGRPDGEARLLPHGRTVELEPVLTSAADALPAALAALRLKPSDITFDLREEDRDVHRRTLVDRILKNPHSLEPEVQRIAAALLAARDRPRDLLTEVCRIGDLPAPGPAPAGDPALEAPHLRAALALYCDRTLDAGDVNDRVALARLSSLPAGFAGALAGLLRACAHARATMAAEAAKLDAGDRAVISRSCMGGKDVPGEKEADRLAKLLAAVAKVDRTRAPAELAAVALAARTVARARDHLSEGQLAAIVSTRVRGRQGDFFLGGAKSDVTGAHDLLVVDVGGDDRHDLTDVPDPSRGFGQVRVIVDCGGDDRYVSHDLPLAGGYCGVGLVWDSAGDDQYDVYACSLGAGVLGAGLLVDEAGDDVYRAFDTSEGYAMFGVGVLVDLRGNDSYFARGHAQGAAGPGGVALLIDHHGQDSYYVNGGYRDFRGEYFDSFAQGYGVGFRSQASGGIGGLVDGDGNDTYSGDYWAQGVGYWFGLGFLVDRAGNDRYNAGRYAQGAGVHNALGALLDGGGSDTYTATAVCQGCGYDLAVGLLHDVSGNDAYLAHDFAQGRGFANGYGLLQDDEGSDTYFSWSTDAQGYGATQRGFGSVGVLLDLGGIDRYAPEGRNNTIMTRGDMGVLLDAPLKGGR